VRNERYADAIAAYKEVLAVEPKDPDAHLGLGNAYFNQGQFAEAEGYYTAAIKLDPDWPIANLYLADTYRLLRRYGEAEAAYKAVERLAPKDPRPIYWLGMIHLVNGNKVAAQGQYEKLKTVNEAEAAKLLEHINRP